jgi:hypothetical protein
MYLLDFFFTALQSYLQISKEYQEVRMHADAIVSSKGQDYFDKA